jgi:phospholipid/cholesterol/gamma-HCH transport system permease protein
MESPFRMDAGELVLTVPAAGIATGWLARPLTELGLPSELPDRALRVDAPPAWRWTTSDAAFLATVVRELEGPARTIEVRGLPSGLKSLLDLSRVASASPAGSSGPRRPDIRARVGAHALAALADARLFVELIGQVLLLAPKYAAGRARIRRADVWEMLADCGHRSLPIVAIVNLLMGGILAFVGAVELQDFGAGIYVANLVGIASIRELTPILVAIVLAGRTGASFAATLATMQANEEIDALTTLGVPPKSSWCCRASSPCRCSCRSSSSTARRSPWPAACSWRRRSSASRRSRTSSRRKMRSAARTSRSAR